MAKLMSMPQEVLTMIVKEFFTGMIIKKIDFTENKSKNVRKLQRSWLAVLLANITISYIAKDLFPKHVTVMTTAAGLISTPPIGKYARHRSGERQLEYFEKAAGDVNFAKKLLHPPLGNKVGRRPEYFYTRFRNLKAIFIQDRHYLERYILRDKLNEIKSLMDQFTARSISFDICFSVGSSIGSVLTVLVKCGKQAQLLSGDRMPKHDAEMYRIAIEARLKFKLPLSYELIHGDEFFRDDEEVAIPKWGSRLLPSW